MLSKALQIPFYITTHTLNMNVHTHSYFNHLNLIILPLLLRANQWCHPQGDSGTVGSVPEGGHAGREERRKLRED